jgi:cytosine/adenosine deaminase-related metal-dependent hydrolase
MLFEMKLALLVHRVKSGVSSMPAYNVLKMATNYGAKILGFDEIGSLEKNKAADIALFKINSIEYAGALHDKATAILFAGNNQTTEYTIVNGKIVVEKGNLVNINKEEIFFKANEIAHNMLKNASTKTGINYYKRQIVK